MSERTGEYYATCKPSEYSDEELPLILAHCGPKEVQGIAPEVEEAARKAWSETPLGHDALIAAVNAALLAATPHALTGTEWGVFRASDDETGTPIENLRYRSREAAQRSIDKGYLQPEFWEVRGRKVGEWRK